MDELFQREEVNTAKWFPSHLHFSHLLSLVRKAVLLLAHLMAGVEECRSGKEDTIQISKWNRKMRSWGQDEASTCFRATTWERRNHIPLPKANNTRSVSGKRSPATLLLPDNTVLSTICPPQKKRKERKHPGTSKCCQRSGETGLLTYCWKDYGGRQPLLC